MKIMKKDRTPHSTEDLCRTCQHSQIMKGQRLDETVYCHNLEAKVPEPLSECSRYHNKSESSLYDMEQIAWVLVTKTDAKQIGFVRAKDMSSAERRKAGFTEYTHD